ncbi:hypothetical protein NicSoilB4_13490 [Arthrobacter sp. NicSoilB4]|nr:hypothetical protein NicSoilB4_13490 [Arthrobacter sp. NicSoilB4]
MLPTSATVAGTVVLSKLLETTFAPGITGRSFSGKPGTMAPTVAEVPGSAEGLAGAVVEGWAEEGAGEADEEPEEAVPGLVGVHAAKAISVPAATTAAAARLRGPNTFTGTFLLVLTPDSASSLVSPGA